jgi:hypothetical protein
MNSIHIYGATICFDDWDNVVKHPLLNVMFAYLNGDVFLSAIDTMGGRGGGCKDAHDYIHNAFVRYIEIVGGETLYKVL